MVDDGGFVVLMIERIDGARPMTADIALSKDYSAAVMQRPAEMLENWRNADPVFFTQVGRMGQRPIVATKGGSTHKRDGAFLGRTGVFGGSPEGRRAEPRHRPPGRGTAAGRARRNRSRRPSLHVLGDPDQFNDDLRKFLAEVYANAA